MKVKLIDGDLEVEVTLKKLAAGEYNLMLEIPETYEMEIVDNAHIIIRPMPIKGHEGEDDEL
jgi:hypothetical protein